MKLGLFKLWGSKTSENIVFKKRFIIKKFFVFMLQDNMIGATKIEMID